MPFETELAVALDAANEAGTLILEHYGKLVPIPDAPSNISTETDLAAQELILQFLHRAFPRDALCAEEKTATLAAAPQAGGRLWIVDPIDGTRGFARKNGEFSVMVAFVEGSVIRVGVVLEPAVGKLTFASQGGGCWRRLGNQKTRCRVGTAADLSMATLTQSRSKTAQDSPVVAKLRPAKVLETYSAGVKLAQVAVGEADLYANVYPAFSDWDICAGHILVEEAGGRVTTLVGKPIRYGAPGFGQTGGLLASNGALHEQALTALK